MANDDFGCSRSFRSIFSLFAGRLFSKVPLNGRLLNTGSRPKRGHLLGGGYPSW